MAGPDRTAFAVLPSIPQTDILAPTISPSMTLLAAGPIWLTTKRGYVGERTLKDYSECSLKRLGEIIGNIRLEQITITVIRNYQLLRRQKAGPSCVNKETNALSQILRLAGLWKDLAPEYKPLPLPMEKKGRALTESEEYHLFTIGNRAEP